MANIFESIFHFEKRELNRYMKEADRVISFEKEIAALSDDELRAKTKHFQEYLKGSANDEEMDRRLEEINVP